MINDFQFSTQFGNLKLEGDNLKRIRLVVTLYCKDPAREEHSVHLNQENTHEHMNHSTVWVPTVVGNLLQ